VNEEGKPAGERSLPARLWQTDDRGVYRLFGLEPGRYLVYAGGGSNPRAGLVAGQSGISEPYYPGPNKKACARAVLIAGGGEAAGINCGLVRDGAKQGFIASGRVIESDTGKPVPGLMLFYAPSGPERAEAAEKKEEQTESAARVANGTTTTNANGEFRFENL